MSDQPQVRQLRLVVTADDYDEALRFYRDVLGLPEQAAFSSPDGRVSILDAGRATLEIADPGHADYIDEVEVGRRVAGHIRVAFEVDDAPSVTATLADAGPATVVLDAGGIALAIRDRRIVGTPLDHEIPDYRRLLREATGGPDRRRVTVDVAGLRERLTAAEVRTVVREQDGTACEVSVLTVDARNTLTVSDADTPAETDVLRVGVNREFLLDALAAAGPGQLVLELDGPIRPLAVRRPGDDRAFSILMPIRL